MNLNAQSLVENFHRKHGLPINTPAGGVICQRLHLIKEEYFEVDKAFWDYHYERTDENLCDLAQELADLMYVTLGAAVELGIPLGKVFAAVHEANMTKSGPVVDGKVVKGEGFVPPDIEGALGLGPAPVREFLRATLGAVGFYSAAPDLADELADALEDAGYLK